MTADEMRISDLISDVCSSFLYAVGDTMLFKVYLTSNMYNYELSKVAYVEVLNGKDSLMQMMRIPLTDHAGDGHLVLDQEWYTQGNYRFRAYTKWMINFDPAYFFNKIVTIGDRSEEHTSALQSLMRNSCAVI